MSYEADPHTHSLGLIKCTYLSKVGYYICTIIYFTIYIK